MLAAFARSTMTSLTKRGSTSAPIVVASTGATVLGMASFARAFAASADGIITGTVKWFNVEKGYGFIQPSDGSPDVFVHQTVIHAEGFRSLDAGEEVEFRTEDDNGRTRAVDVTGPEGAFVKGAPRRQNNRYNDRDDGDGF